MAIKFIRKMKPFNRRQSVRLNISCLAKYNVEGQIKRMATLTNLVNLSEGGARVVTFDARLAPKTKIELQFQLPTATRPIAVQGEVVQSYPRKKKVYQAGVRFVGLRDDDRHNIRNFIHQIGSSHRRTA